MYRIGVSSVGSGIGESVINSIRLSALPLFSLGLGNNPFAFGGFSCNQVEFLPAVHEPEYLDNLISTLKKHRIDIVIPGLDDEVLVFSKAEQQFTDAGIQAIAPGQALIALCRDKAKLSKEMNQVANIFARSYEMKDSNEALDSDHIRFPFIAKPRNGSASQGVSVVRNNSDLQRISERHIIQELVSPSQQDPNLLEYLNLVKSGINPQLSEISVQLVADKKGTLIGRMASYNKLKKWNSNRDITI